MRPDPPAPDMVNIPVDPYTRGDALHQLGSDTWLPRLREFQPEFVFISAGFDGHREDDMGQLGLIESDYAWITAQIVELANETAEGRVVSLLEGGYSLSALGRSEEHTSELQSLMRISYAVFCLKKKNDDK